MIYGRLITDESSRSEVRDAMPVYGQAPALILVGYYDGSKCIGGAYLQRAYPNKLVMEFYTRCPTIINGIADSYRYFLDVKQMLHAEVEITNTKSLKMVQSIGFKKVRYDARYIHYQFSRHDWRFSKRLVL